MITLAHAADWISSLVFAAPVLGFGLWLAITAVRDRRRRRREGDDRPLP